MDAFSNKYHKTKLFDGIDQDDMTMLEAKITAIKGVDLYNLVRVVKICLVPNVVVPKKFDVPEFIKYIGIMSHDSSQVL